MSMDKEGECLKQKISAWLESIEKITEEVECYRDDEFMARLLLQNFGLCQQVLKNWPEMLREST